MNNDYINKTRIPDIENRLNESIDVMGAKKIEERMCYDAYWEVYTNLGTITLKMYDGLSQEDFLNKCKCCNTVYELFEIQPKCFYYD